MIQNYFIEIRERCLLTISSVMVEIIRLYGSPRHLNENWEIQDCSSHGSTLKLINEFRVEYARCFEKLDFSNLKQISKQLLNSSPSSFRESSLEKICH